MTTRRAKQKKRTPRLRGKVRTTGHRRGIRGLAFGVLAVAVMAAAAYLLWPVIRQSGAASPGATKVQLSMGGFSPSRLEGQVGQPITLLLVNMDNKFHAEWDGGGWHQFAIDELGVNEKVAPLGTQEFTFIPPKSGTFEFYCDVCCGGRANPAMVGTVIVRG